MVWGGDLTVILNQVNSANLLFVFIICYLFFVFFLF